MPTADWVPDRPTQKTAQSKAALAQGLNGAELQDFSAEHCKINPLRQRFIVAAKLQCSGSISTTSKALTLSGESGLAGGKTLMEHNSSLCPAGT